MFREIATLFSLSFRFVLIKEIFSVHFSHNHVLKITTFLCSDPTPTVSNIWNHCVDCTTTQTLSSDLVNINDQCLNFSLANDSKDDNL